MSGGVTPCRQPRFIVILLKFVDIVGITQIDVLVNSSICVHLL